VNFIDEQEFRADAPLRHVGGFRPGEINYFIMCAASAQKQTQPGANGFSASDTAAEATVD
jgi:hypothetical protein